MPLQREIPAIKEKYLTDMVQNQAIRFIARIKGTKGIREAMKNLEIPSGEPRRLHQRMRLLTRIHNKEVHSALIQSW